MDGPLLTLTATIWIYWLTVGALAVHQRVVRGRRAGVVPQERGERLMWRIWVPVIAGWICRSSSAEPTAWGHAWEVP